MPNKNGKAAPDAPSVPDTFDRALQAYKAAPNPHTLLSLNKAAIPLMMSVAQRNPWRQVVGQGGETLDCDFTAIRVVADERLDEAEVARLAGCLGYALRATLVGEELGEPSASVTASGEETGPTFTVIEFAYNGASSARSQPDVLRAFTVAREYIAYGSPVRTTDREGPGTAGTRLVEGLKTATNLSFYVR